MVIRELKNTAKELKIPIIVLSQLSRAVETRGGGKRPLLSDLRDSGAIENNADVVGFIYRPEYYKMDEWDDDEGTPCANEAEVIIAKHRNGKLENIRLNFSPITGEFSNWTSKEYNFGSFGQSIEVDEGNPFESNNKPFEDGNVPF